MKKATAKKPAGKKPANQGSAGKPNYEKPIKSSVKKMSNKSGMLYTTKQPGGTRGK
jgi:hypothetical protein